MTVKVLYPNRPIPNWAKYGSNVLTEREQTIIRLVALGLKNKEIAKRVRIKTYTVKNYIHKIFDKTGMGNRVELALWHISKRIQ